MHFISIKPVLSDYLSYVTLFQCSHGRSYKTGLTVFETFRVQILNSTLARKWIIVVVRLLVIYFQYSACKSSSTVYYIEFTFLSVLKRRLKKTLIFIVISSMIFSIVRSSMIFFIVRSSMIFFIVRMIFLIMM